MADFISKFNNILNTVNGVIWHNWVLYIVLGVGLLFTIWSGFCQYRALTHGVSVTRGKYDNEDDPGAINHFQALSAALSATVGLGNIAGVALAIMLGGPGAVFWMWVVGLVGMALKTTEVTLSMIYRNTDDPENPHGGPMYVAQKAFAARGMPRVGKVVGGIFVVTLLVSTITGGNMFQAWNVADITHQYFGIPQVAVGIVLALLVGMVIIGGIKRIGAVAGRLVPFMCGVYLLAALYVVALNIELVPGILKLIVVEAFTPSEASGAFLGGTMAYALLWGMKRALFSSEAGQGSSPIAHSAAKTDEPVREGVVAGLEPFIDTLVVCTLTSLVILSTGVWNRGPDLELSANPVVIVSTDAEGSEIIERDDKGDPIPGGWIEWTLEPTPIVEIDSIDFRVGSDVFVTIEAEHNPNTGLKLHRLKGKIAQQDDQYVIDWSAHGGGTHKSAEQISVVSDGAFFDFKGATLTAKAFDSVTPGLGMWLVTAASWLFALSTAISWSYYGEQGMVYLFGDRSVMPYKLVYCLLIIIASIPQLIATDAQLDNLTALGTGVMLWANIPIMLIFGSIAMKAYKDYMKRLDAGEFQPHKAPPITDIVEGKDHDNSSES